ncbi:MAG: hypothetical protein QG620_918 [Patescibacteria group bacterium]|nr:hypothetical protein [Patescibacteria group bacterium]
MVLTLISDNLADAVRELATLCLFWLSNEANGGEIFEKFDWQ